MSAASPHEAVLLRLFSLCFAMCFCAYLGTKVANPFVCAKFLSKKRWLNLHFHAQINLWALYHSLGNDSVFG